MPAQYKKNISRGSGPSRPDGRAEAQWGIAGAVSGFVLAVAFLGVAGGDLPTRLPERSAVPSNRPQGPGNSTVLSSKSMATRSVGVLMPVAPKAKTGAATVSSHADRQPERPKSCEELIHQLYPQTLAEARSTFHRSNIEGLAELYAMREAIQQVKWYGRVERNDKCLWMEQDAEIAARSYSAMIIVRLKQEIDANPRDYYMNVVRAEKIIFEIDMAQYAASRDERNYFEQLVGVSRKGMTEYIDSIAVAAINQAFSRMLVYYDVIRALWTTGGSVDKRQYGEMQELRLFLVDHAGMMSEAQLEIREKTMDYLDKLDTLRFTTINNANPTLR